MSNKKRVLIVCTTDSMIWNFLIPHIRDLESKGVVVECACSRTGFYFDELVNEYHLCLHEIEFERNPFKTKNIGAYRKLSKLIHDNKYDVIYGHEPVGGAMARLAGKRRNKQVIYISHGFHFFNKAPIKHWILYYVFEYILSFFTDAIITICREDYQHACKFHAKRCYYIPGIGVDFSKFDMIDKEEARNKHRIALGFADDDIVLISVGELSIRKNHQVILHAIARVKNPKIKLIICGEGEQYRSLVNLTKKLGIDNQVVFLGFRRDVPEVLCASDIFVFPSLWEGLGLAGIEAMYSQLPVIGSNRQGIKDYVVPQKTGMLFEPCDVDELKKYIAQLVQDDELRRRMAINGKNKALEFSLQNSIKSLENIYIKEKVISEEK